MFLFGNFALIENVKCNIEMYVLRTTKDKWILQLVQLAKSNIVLLYLLIL